MISSYHLMALSSQLSALRAAELAEQQAAEWTFLQTLDWTVDQVLAYSERISGVHRRLCAYRARKS